ncbi:MAG: ABC transporter ATP-binding protein [Clostridia bacterium]|nr:ABC transporter ATP-binding protein [Clostridia bacterium]
MKKWFNKIRNIAWLCRPYWKYGKVFFVLSIVLSVGLIPFSDILYVYSPEIIVDLLAEERSFAYIAVAALILAGANSVCNILPKLFNPFFTKKQTEIDLEVGKDIYKKSTEIDYRYVDNPKYYHDYSWALNEYVNQTNRTFRFVKRFLTLLLSIIALGSVVIAVGPWLLAIEIIQLFFQRFFIDKRNKVNLKMKDDLIPIDRRISYCHRLFYLKDYAADLKTTPLKEWAFGSYDAAGKEKIATKYQYAKRTSAITVMQEALFIVTELCIMLYLIHSIVAGNISETGLYITMLLSFYRLDSKLYELIQLVEESNDIAMNAEKIRHFFNTDSEIECSKQIAIPHPIDSGNFTIEFRNVAFSYENSDFSLSGINLKINPGEKVAIVGENGVGKSTLVKLLMRLYDVSAGDILINGISIKDYAVNDLRQHIGIAFQNPNVYAMSFAENLSLFGSISDSVLEKIVKDLELLPILHKNQADFASPITKEFDENGIVLSGGEAQRISLARLMTRNWGLLLLDEPSSALDPIAEYRMNQLLLNAANKATTIVVAHRLSTIRNVDKIVVMEQGRILEIGTHAELMSKNGKYCEMFSKQAENYQN